MTAVSDPTGMRSIATPRMQALRNVRNCLRSTSFQIIGWRLNVEHSSMAESTMDLSMRNVSLSRAASTRLCASSTMISSDSGSPGRSRLVIRLSLISGSRMWTYGAATTLAPFMRAFLAS